MKHLSKIVPALSTCLILFFSSFATARYIVRPQDQAVFHNNQGVTYLNQGNPEKALFEFKTATEISNQYTEAWNNLGITYLFLKKYDEAKQAFQKSISIDGKYPSPYNHMATLYYNQGNYQEALGWAKKAIGADKKFADGYYNQGIINLALYKQTGDSKYFNDGEQAFRYATEANSRHYLANFELGNLYRAQGKLEEALIRYKVALEIQPSAAEVWVALGSLYLQKGESNNAQMAFNKAMAADPNNSEAHLNMGLYYMQEKNFILAERELAQAQSAQPDNPRVLFNLAYLKLAQAEAERGRSGPAAASPLYQEAINRYQALLQKMPDNVDAVYNLAYTYSRLGNFSQATPLYEKTLSLDPRYGKALFGLAAIKLEAGDKRSAVDLLCRFVQVAAPDMKSSIDAAQKIIAENGKCK
jgi:Flp pilus assembly protein TadD